MIDVNNDGKISLSELDIYLLKHGTTFKSEELKKLVTNGKEIEYAEFK